MSGMGIFSMYIFISATLSLVTIAKFNVSWVWSLTDTRDTSLLEIFLTPAYNFRDSFEATSLSSLYLSNNSDLFLNWEVESVGILEKNYSLTSNAGPFTFICFLFLPLTSVIFTSFHVSSTFCFLGVLVVASSSVSMASKKSLLFVFLDQLGIGVIIYTAGTILKGSGCNELTSFTE